SEATSMTHHMTEPRVLVLFVAAAALGCSAGGEPPPAGGAGGSVAAGGSGGSGGGIVPPGGTGGGLMDPGTVDPNDGRDLEVRKKTCDANGQNCTCLRLALLGTLDSAANQKDTQPFVDWLNGNSDGTATVTMVTAKPTIDAAFLANYDILLVANVNAWTFTDAETAAVETWARETGGGIVALTGFDSTDAEPAATGR